MLLAVDAVSLCECHIQQTMLVHIACNAWQKLISRMHWCKYTICASKYLLIADFKPKLPTCAMYALPTLVSMRPITVLWVLCVLLRNSIAFAAAGLALSSATVFMK